MEFEQQLNRRSKEYYQTLSNNAGAGLLYHFSCAVLMDVFKIEGMDLLPIETKALWTVMYSDIMLTGSMLITIQMPRSLKFVSDVLQAGTKTTATPTRKTRIK
jgi:hypothetical protein